MLLAKNPVFEGNFLKKDEKIAVLWDFLLESPADGMICRHTSSDPRKVESAF